MRRRRIAITILRRRRTIVLTRDTELPRDSELLERLSPDPTTNTDVEKRRDDHEYKDENSDDIHSRYVGIWLDASTIDLSPIRESIDQPRQLRESGNDAVDEQQLQAD
jgi:hypothetical protein